ncbi:type II toxin-antitoxin system RelE/ParE family toxin [Sinorhizobium meliloti]|nr:type II toxin-antitoxin system RelE/ParE family toxin [Sinorhizobium meliloti]WKL26089.1 type II toxin-antitoxin system RelE/ParE family toxin [Sinorhizobium meliloti]WKL30925.1 type II toxin-antitoxin system RelE/ParE family toxin [Sinorhizobium meliloti]WKL36595.1 type II toxin-antitoxin system RelE/ParE family toxin [Sinorhizobium meliloti]WKL40994.1 type II toxin-antitoxin system RelE/ParE family toxin [Sinorhizobium meliloti]
MSRELVFTPAALADLEETFWFVAADNPRRARSYVAEIEQAAAISARRR